MSAGEDIIAGAVNTALREQGHVGRVVDYIVVAAWMDDAGEQRMYVSVTPDQRAVTTLGLLDYGQTKARARVARIEED